MNQFQRGFSVSPIDQQPEGYLARGDEFEYAFPPEGPQSTGYGTIHIHTFRVVGWEKQIDGVGNERISVRVTPIASRERRPVSLSWKQCDLGHTHEVFEYSESAPLKGVAPEIWGTVSTTDIDPDEQLGYPRDDDGALDVA